MLPASNRMRRPAQFSDTLRAGRSAARGALVVHRSDVCPAGGSPGEPLIGLIVGRTVGGSVVRHRVSRRLRAQLAARLDVLPPGSAVVVRARASASTATSDQLGADLDRALRAVSPTAAGRGR